MLATGNSGRASQLYAQYQREVAKLHSRTGFRRLRISLDVVSKLISWANTPRMSMVVRPQTPQVDAELQGVEFARVLSLVGHYQTYAGQQVLALHQNGDPGTPTPTSAATSASCKKASGAASRSRGNSDCSKQSPGSRSRRYHNNSGARRARLASMSSPGRARATVADPVNTFVERSIKSMQGKILLHMGGSGRKSYDSSYDSSSSTSSSSNIINLEVDCKARPDAPTRTTGCIPAVYDCAGQQLDGSPGECCHGCSAHVPLL